MNNYKYIPTYAGQPIAESKSYLDSLEKQYDLAKDKKNALDVFLGGFQSNDEDGKKYIDEVKGILTDKVQEIAKDSKGNIKWHTAMEGLDSVASQVAGDMKLKHVQERYNKYKEEEDLVRKIKLEKGNNSFYGNEVPNKAFDENGDSMQYQNRYELKLDHMGAAKKLVDQMHDQIETITSDTAIPGYIQTGKRQFVKADGMEPMLEKAYDLALNNSPELQQMAKREGEDAVKKLIKDTLGLGEYDYTQTQLTNISGSGSGKKEGEEITPDNALRSENFAPSSNSFEGLDSITASDLNKTSTSNNGKIISVGGAAIRQMGDTKGQEEKFTTVDMYSEMLKSQVGEEEFNKMTEEQKVNAINSNIKNYNQKASTAYASSSILRLDGLRKELAPGFDTLGETEIKMNMRGGVYVVGESGKGLDQQTLAQKIGNQIDTKTAKAIFKGIYFGNDNSDSSFDGGFMYTLKDANGNGIDVVIPQPNINSKILEHGQYRREKSELVRNKKAFSAEGVQGKSVDYVVNYFNDDSIKTLLSEGKITEKDINIIKELEMKPYTRWDSKEKTFKSGSTITKSKLPANTSPQELESLLKTLNMPYSVDNGKIIIDDNFMDSYIKNSALSTNTIKNAFKTK
jgi:hypothetical protein